MTLLLQLLADAFVNGAVFAVLACSFGLVYRTMRVFHIAFAGVFPLCPYVAWVANDRLKWSILPSILAGIVASAILGWLLEVLLYQPFSRRRAGAGATTMASMGVWVVFVAGYALLFGNEVRTLDRGIATRVGFGALSVTTVQALAFAICLATVGALLLAVRMNHRFTAIWAIGEEPGLAMALGFPVSSYRRWLALGSAALCGVGSGLVALDVGIQPSTGMSYLMVAMVAVLAGGLDSLAGWIVGAFVLAVLHGILVWKLSASWIDLATFTVLISILLFRPQGMLGTRKRLEEL